MGRIIPYIVENKIHVWNHQPVYIVELKRESWATNGENQHQIASGGFKWSLKQS